MTLDKKLNDAFEEMMKYRQSIGYATATYRSSVPPFINFCVKNHPLSARITQEMVDEWLIYYPYTVNSKAAFLSLLREYTKYLNFLGYDDYIPDDDYVVKRIAFNPYLFTHMLAKPVEKDICQRLCFLCIAGCFTAVVFAHRNHLRYEQRM